MTLLPAADYFQYISHLYHSKELVPWTAYQPDPTWDYPRYDKARFEKILAANRELFQEQRVLDLGCHTGFMLYVAHTLGAQSITGVNARSYPIQTAEYFFQQLGIPVALHCNNIEDFSFISNLLDQTDTVILASILEHLRNPEYLLSLLSKSNVKNLVIESTIATDDNILPRLSYRIEKTAWDFASFDNGAEKSLACVPNRRFLETVLYHYGWKISNMVIEQEFSNDWFATQNLDAVPTYRTYTVITAERF